MSRGVATPSVRTAEVFTVVSFIVHFERNASLLSGDNTAELVQAMLDKRHENEELHLAGRKRYSVCSVDWLRDFFDNKMTLPHESLFVMIMLVHVVMLALSASTDSPELRGLLYALNIVHGLDVFGRILAEGFNDFWTFIRLRKMHDSGENLYVWACGVVGSGSLVGGVSPHVRLLDTSATPLVH